MIRSLINYVYGPFFWLFYHLNFITMPDHKYLSRNHTIWGIIPIHIMLKM